MLFNEGSDNIVDDERVSDFSFKNEGVDRLTPHTDDDIPPYPMRPCFACGCRDYWLRKASRWGRAEWLCSRCHPQPKLKTGRVGIPPSIHC